MAASYPSSVKSFTTKGAGDTIQPGHVNDAQDEIVAVEQGLLNGFTHDLFNTAWTDYSSTSTVTGWSSTTTKKIFYKKLGRLVFVAFQIEGTSDATSASFTVPVARPADGFSITFVLAADTTDNSATVETKAYGTLGSGISTVSMYQSAASGTWTASGSKHVAGQFWYEAAS